MLGIAVRIDRGLLISVLGTERGLDEGEEKVAT
jgi:hypothetical protein